MEKWFLKFNKIALFFGAVLCNLFGMYTAQASKFKEVRKCMLQTKNLNQKKSKRSATGGYFLAFRPV